MDLQMRKVLGLDVLMPDGSRHELEVCDASTVGQFKER